MLKLETMEPCWAQWLGPFMALEHCAGDAMLTLRIICLKRHMARLVRPVALVNMPKNQPNPLGVWIFMYIFVLLVGVWPISIRVAYQPICGYQSIEYHDVGRWHNVESMGCDGQRRRNLLKCWIWLTYRTGLDTVGWWVGWTISDYRTIRVTILDTVGWWVGRRGWLWSADWILVGWLEHWKVLMTLMLGHGRPSEGLIYPPFFGSKSEAMNCLTAEGVYIYI